ncbi:GON-4-like protein isoform X1 [Acipenser ruthenus]|uniref:GON-4-like protein isoform X1 n=1 Tax=Acipenser ruthenus TaxID=7906 RepID=UPI0027423C6F|nr:GON-4-like protein isoform X1 [Acipenser ruthenus]XP_058863301.1 GON-4-like protein isoform X1 [Acipenser ruthenus]
MVPFKKRKSSAPEQSQTQPKSSRKEDCPRPPASLRAPDCPRSPASLRAPDCSRPPASLSAPDCSRPPASLSAPDCPRPPASLSAPDCPRSPASLRAPDCSRPPASLSAPDCPRPPASLSAPDCSRPPASLRAPDCPRPPASLSAPDCPRPPASLSAPDCPRPPASLRAPDCPRPPASLRAPDCPQPPASLRAPDCPRPPASLKAPDCPRPPASLRAPDCPRPPASLRAPDCPRPPASLRAPDCSQPPASLRAPDCSRPPASLSAPDCPRPPASLRAPDCPRPPASLSAPDCSRPPASLSAPDCSRPPASLSAPDCPRPPASLSAPDCSRPPASLSAPDCPRPPASLSAPDYSRSPASLRAPDCPRPPASLRAPDCPRPPASLSAQDSKLQPLPAPPPRPPEKKISTSTAEPCAEGTKGRGQGNTPETSSPQKLSPRVKGQSQTRTKESELAGSSCHRDPPAVSEECPLEVEGEEDGEFGLVITLDGEESGEGGGRRRKRKGVKRKRGEGAAPAAPPDCEIEVGGQLDRDLESQAKQHNLTTINVRNIIHEVITNEHVVAMMKAAISDTEDMPMFEPKMTRSKLKEVVEKGVVIPTWNISPIKKSNEVKPPQFVDIPLEDEDSSDEEYCPDEEEDDETAEETFQESDVESTASSPRGGRRPRTPFESGDEECSYSPTQQGECPVAPQQRHLSVEVVPMGPPPPPKPAKTQPGSPKPARQTQDCSFMEKLHAVEEELALSPVCMDPLQAMVDSLIALRTRSKRPLKDIPLGQLEAELQAPDITPDMYETGTNEDREWQGWLRGLMTSEVENEEEADDDDDPEYNFLEDMDEPDQEDFRNDRAVRITKKEVNELMEELFETFQEELGVPEPDDEGPEEDEEKEEPPQGTPKFNVPQAIKFEEPLSIMLSERHRTVREQLEALRQRRAMAGVRVEAASPPRPPPPPPHPLPRPHTPQPLCLSQRQKLHLQQQMQQHVQLLTQCHMLTSVVPGLESEATTTRLFLSELLSFADRAEMACCILSPGFTSAFRACNLQGALCLLDEFDRSVRPELTPPGGSPHKTRAVKTTGTDAPTLPCKVAWMLATRKEFLYPELLPVCSLDPQLKSRKQKTFYAKGEDSLLVLGLKHFAETEYPRQFISKYLLPGKTPEQIQIRLRKLSLSRTPSNDVKYYRTYNEVPVMARACRYVPPTQARPPVERELSSMPIWLQRSLPYIYECVMDYTLMQLEREGLPASLGEVPPPPPIVFPPGVRYPPEPPKDLVLPLKLVVSRYPRKSFKFRKRPTVMRPLLIRPPPCTPPGLVPLAKAPPQTTQAHLTARPLNLNPTVTLTRISGKELLQKLQSPSKSLCSKDGLIAPTGTKRSVHVQQAKTLAPAPSPAPFRELCPISKLPMSCPVFKLELKKVNRRGPRKARTKQVYSSLCPRKVQPIQPAPPPSAPPPPPSHLVFAIPAGGQVQLLSLGGPPSNNSNIMNSNHNRGMAAIAASLTQGLGGVGGRGGPLSAGPAGPRSMLQPTTVFINPASFPMLATPCSVTAPPVPSSLGTALVYPVPSSDLAHQGVVLGDSKHKTADLPLSVAPKDPPNCPLSRLRQLITLVPPSRRSTGSSQNFEYHPVAVATGKEHPVSSTPPPNTSPIPEDPNSGPKGSAPPHPDNFIPESKPDFLIGEFKTSPASSPEVVEPAAQTPSPCACLLREVKQSPGGSPPLPVEEMHIDMNISSNKHIVKDIPSTPSPTPSPTPGPARSPAHSLYPDSQLSPEWYPLVPSHPPTADEPYFVPEEPPFSESDGEGEELDFGGGGEEEEEEGGGWDSGSDFGEPMLALSESTGSPASSLDGQADALERLMEVGTPLKGEGGETMEEEEGGGGGEKDAATPERTAHVSLDTPHTEISPPPPSPDEQQQGDGIPPAEWNREVERLCLGEHGEGRTEREAGVGGHSLSADAPPPDQQGAQNSGGVQEEQGGGTVEGEGEGEAEEGGTQDEEEEEGEEEDDEGEREEPEEEEDFDDLTQDEDEEEVMSSASEESVLSVPELQETMEKLTWLASERRDANSEEENSPNSQEENSEEEEEGPQKGEEESGEGGVPGGAGGETPRRSGTPETSGKGAGRRRGEAGRGARQGKAPYRSRRKRSRVQASKDASKLVLLCDEDILEKDPLREHKDIAFAQTYLNRVREALQDSPGKMEQFLRLLFEFETSSEPRTAVDLYLQLSEVLRDWPELLRDFAAFLLPEQALQCGLFEEQQAFERSRKFLRQLEICFEENPSHYQKVVRMLQGGPELPQADIEELKVQMWTLLKGHHHLQTEFSSFFEQLHPPPSRPSHFEEVIWTEERERDLQQFDGFEEVTLPDLEEEEEPAPPKLPSTGARSRRRKELGAPGGHDKEWECTEGGKDCPCSCHKTSHEGKLRRHKRKSCPRCHRSKQGGDASKGPKSKETLEPSAGSPPNEGKQKQDEDEEEEEEEEVGEAEEAEEKGRQAGGSEPHTPVSDSCSSQDPSGMEVQVWGSPDLGVTLPRKKEERGEEEEEEEERVEEQEEEEEKREEERKEEEREERKEEEEEREEEEEERQEEGDPSRATESTQPSPNAINQSATTTAMTSLDPAATVATETERRAAQTGGVWEGGGSLEEVKRQSGGSSVCSSPSLLLPHTDSAPASPKPQGCSASPSRQGAQGTRDTPGVQQGTPSPPCGSADSTVCAKNISVSATGEKVILWTREADRVILTTCQRQGANQSTFQAISGQLGNKTPNEVSARFRELMLLFHTGAQHYSSEEEEEGAGLSEQLTDEELD